MLNFKSWLEMSDFTTADISHITFQKYNNRLYYDFTVGSKEYQVYFIGPQPFKIPPVTISNDTYSITFSQEGEEDITHNSDNPTAVYGEVAKATKKFILDYNPEVLKFNAFDQRQTIIYERLYRLYLSKAYTRLGSYAYMRNDLYHKFEQENGTIWKILQDLNKVGYKNINKEIESAKNYGLAQRQTRAKLKLKKPPPKEPPDWTQV